jgi:oxazoline/thiazoline synthase
MAVATPRFRSCFLVEHVGDEGIFLLYEGGYATLSGKLYSRLARLIDGEHTPEEIADLLDGQHSAPEVYYGLGHLEQRGFITTAADELPLNVSAYWDALRLDGADAAHSLADATVTLTALDESAAPAFTAALAGLGVRTVDADGFSVVLTNDYARAELATINREQIAAGKPWLLAKLTGTGVWLGPIFRPHQTGCWECLVQRLRTNRVVEGFLMEQSGADQPFETSRGWLPTTLNAAANLAATEVAKWLAGRAPEALDGALVTLNTVTLATERHVLTRRPQCPACGTPEQFAEPARIALQSRPKRYTADGGHRILFPEQTFERLEPHVSPITGVITALTRNDTGENPLIHSYVAGHNFARAYPDLRTLRQSLRTMAGGKGTTDIQAKVSAMGEAIERYAGVFRGDEPRIQGSLTSLGDKAIDPRKLLLYSDEQYRTRQASYKAADRFHTVPAPFDPDAVIDWTPVWSMVDNTFKYVPTAYCFYNYASAVGIPLDKTICYADSNGSAAGNTLEEAILQGFMEVVERDCVALFWYNMIQRPAVDLDSFDDPYFRLLQEHFRNSKRDLWVIDITNDLGIPTFCGVTWRTDRGDKPQELVVGFGAHFDARLAVLRALTECNQFLAGFERFGETDHRYAGFEPLAVEWWKTATLANQPYLTPDPKAPKRTLADYGRPGSNDLRDDVEACVRIANEHGLETLILNQSRPDVPLSVAKVMLPGARHFWQRFAPGRLYDVPVQLGWIDAPLREDQLNPFPLFF